MQFFLSGIQVHTIPAASTTAPEFDPKEIKVIHAPEVPQWGSWWHVCPGPHDQSSGSVSKNVW